MSKDRIPYFDFYPSDFMHGIRGLSAQEVGVYTMILCRIYEENSPVEYHTMRLSTYCGMREATFIKTFEKLVELDKLQLTDGTVSNRRAMAEISSRAHKLKINSKAGKASAKKRQQNQRNISTSVQRTFNHTDTDITSSLRSEVKAQAPAKPSVKSELMKVLNEEQAQAVIEHRRALKKPLTFRAAELLIKKLARCPDSSAAADMMIESGWLSIEPEWIENRRKSNTRSSAASNRPLTHTDIWGAALREKGILSHEPDSHEPNILDASDEHGYRESNVHPLRIASARSY